MSITEIEQFITDNYLQMTDRELSEHVPLSLSGVNVIRHRLGLKSPQRLVSYQSVTPLKKSAECYELWMTGMTIADVAKRIKLSAATASRMIDRFLPTRSKDTEIIIRQSKINL